MSQSEYEGMFEIFTYNNKDMDDSNLNDTTNN